MNQHKRIAQVFVLLLILVLVYGCQKSEEIVNFPNELYMDLPVNIGNGLSADTLPPLIILKDVQFYRGDTITTENLVEIIDASPVTTYLLDENGKEQERIYFEEEQTVTIKAVDTFGNVSCLEIFLQPALKREDIPLERNFASFHQFPFENIEYISGDTYAYIKSAYQEIQWVNEFYPGEAEFEEEYKLKYKQLLDGEMPILYHGKTYSIDEYLCLDKDYSPENVFNGDGSGLDGPYHYSLYLFDADADGKQELIVQEMPGRQALIFKYIPESDAAIIWEGYWSGHEHPMGSRIIGGYWESQEFWWRLLDENGETEIAIQFFNGFFYNHGEDFYMVSIPVYSDIDETTVPDSVKSEGYYNEMYDCVCYHVTEQQYQELTDVFFEEYYITSDKLEEMSCSYEELFGE